MVSHIGIATSQHSYPIAPQPRHASVFMDAGSPNFPRALRHPNTSPGEDLLRTGRMNRGVRRRLPYSPRALGPDGRPIDYSHFGAREFGGYAIRKPGSPNSQGVAQLVQPHPSSETHAAPPSVLHPHIGRWRQGPLPNCVHWPRSDPGYGAVSYRGTHGWGAAPHYPHEGNQSSTIPISEI